jgi:hypothetical protein
VVPANVNALDVQNQGSLAPGSMSNYFTTHSLPCARGSVLCRRVTFQKNSLSKVGNEDYGW